MGVPPVQICCCPAAAGHGVPPLKLMMVPAAALSVPPLFVLVNAVMAPAPGYRPSSGGAGAPNLRWLHIHIAQHIVQ